MSEQEKADTRNKFVNQNKPQDIYIVRVDSKFPQKQKIKKPEKYRNYGHANNSLAQDFNYCQKNHRNNNVMEKKHHIISNIF